MSDPIWIVNRLGELGVFVNGEAHFLYKGDSLHYHRGEDPEAVPYRRVHKREFGECQHSVAQIEAGQCNGGDFYHGEADRNAEGLWVTEGEPPRTYRGPDFVFVSKGSSRG